MKEYKHPRHQRCLSSHALEGQKIKLFDDLLQEESLLQNPSKHFWMTIQIPHLNIFKKGFRMDVTTATNPYQHDTTDLVYPTSTLCSRGRWLLANWASNGWPQELSGNETRKKKHPVQQM